MLQLPRVRAFLLAALFLSATGLVLAGQQAISPQPFTSAELAQKLPIDPAVTTGTFPNGLKY